MTKTRKERGVRRGTPLVVAAARQIASSLARFEEHALVLDTVPLHDTEETVIALHELRIATKQLRYTIELFQEVLPPDAVALLRALRELQDDLGYLHDRDVLLARLRDECALAARREVAALNDLATTRQPRKQRLAAIEQHLRDGEGAAASTLGLYGLMVNAADERRARFVALPERWQTLAAEGFRTRLAALTRAERA